MKKIVFAVLALFMIAGCSPQNQESSAEKTVIPESTESIVSSAENSVISESSVQSPSEESKPDSKTESTVKESSVESKTESHEEPKPENSQVSQTSTEEKKESSVVSMAEHKKESSVEEKSQTEESVPVSNMAVTGFYKLTDITSDGESFIDMEQYVDEGLHVTLELFADGTGEFKEYNEIVKITWNDKYIMLDGDKVNYKLLNNKLALYSDDNTFLFEKTDKAAFIREESSAVTELSGPIDESVVGRYILTDMTVENNFDTDIYLTLNADGTGVVEADTDKADITWDDGEIELDGEIFYYETDNRNIIVDFYGIYCTFQKL